MRALAVRRRQSAMHRGLVMTEGIPVIDLGSARPLANERIGRACREWGFFQIVGHGIAPALIDRVWTLTHAFFALPRSVKLGLLRTKHNPRGYYDRELTKNRRDLKEVFDFGGAQRPDLPDAAPENRVAVDGSNRWPDELPTLRPTLLAYVAVCERLAFDLSNRLTDALGVVRDALAPYFAGGHTSFARLNYYPREDPLDAAAAHAAPALGSQALHHHTDAGALTILLQNRVGGLQVCARGRWVDVEPIPGALVVNVGDMMQVWSNDRFTAAMHRVRPMRDHPRYSIPFFFNPSYEARCAPLPTPDGDQPHYREIEWGAFRQARTDGDYADYGKEIQIADFRIEVSARSPKPEARTPEP